MMIESIEPLTIVAIMISVTIAIGVGMKLALIIRAAISPASATGVPGNFLPVSTSPSSWLSTNPGSIHFM